MISVIIPAYNVENYIDACLCSVTGQSYDDLEIIVVNDGSTDKTGGGIGRFAGDGRVKVVEHKNSGVAASRNVGLDAARGEFITFVDSDDYLEPYMYERLLKGLRGSDSDVAVCDYNLNYGDHMDRAYSGMKDEVIDVSAGIVEYFYKYCACPKPNNYIWTRLYRTELVKRAGVRFEAFKLGDDTMFNFKLLPWIQRVSNVSGGAYNYLQRTDSNIYTSASKTNLATVYADAFDSIAGSWQGSRLVDALPVFAYTRLRSVIFYSKLAGLDNERIAERIVSGFKDRSIADYLQDTQALTAYARINALPGIEGIRELMTAAAKGDLQRLAGEIA